MSGIAAGRLRHQVVIEQQVTAINSSGEQDVDWETFATVWAEVAPLSARESILSEQAQSKVSARITIRALDGVAASMRVVHGSTIYNIEGVIPDPQSGVEWMTLTCSTGLNSG